MKLQKDNKPKYQLQKPYEEKYMKYLEKRYGKKRTHLFYHPSD